MKTKTIIDTTELSLRSKLKLKNGRIVSVRGFLNSMLPTIKEVYEIYTDIGTVLPDEVERIL